MNHPADGQHDGGRPDRADLPPISQPRGCLPDDVRAAPGSFPTAPSSCPICVLKTFLRENLYHHYQVLRMTDKARRIIQDLFGRS